MLEHFAATILGFAQHSHGWIYLIVLLAALIEALPIVGTLFPGHSIVILAGAVAVEGDASWLLLMVAATLGAVIGDGIAFFVGERYGTGLLRKRGPLIRRAAKESRKFFTRYGFWSIVIGRFNTLTRAFVPLFAGSTRMRRRDFWISNVIGGVLWSVSSILIGMLLGHGYRLLYKQVGAYTLLVVALCVVVWYGYTRVIRRLFEEHPRASVFSVSAAGLLVFAILLDAVTDLDTWLAGAVQSFDGRVAAWAGAHDGARQFWLFITQFGGAFAIVCVIAIAIIVLRKRKDDLKLFAWSSAVGFLLDSMVKVIIARPRPDTAIAVVGYSFPSGHAVMATVVYGSIAVILWRSRHWRYALALPLLAILVGISRIMIGVHWTSDVIAGFGLGVAIIFGVLFAERFRQDIHVTERP